MVNVCCSDMSNHLYLISRNNGNNNSEKHDKVIYYSSRFNEYGIPLDDGISYILIEYCPWCGQKLPNSLREKWFAELEKLGYETPLFDDNIPEKYMSSLWWKKDD